MSKTKYVVCDGHTLGYRTPECWIGILQTNVLKGAAGAGNMTHVSQFASIRPATAADFKGFRVMLPPDFVEPTQLYDCQVWDSVTGEWDRVLVGVELPEGEGDLGHSEVANKLGQAINEAVSIAKGEAVGDWHLQECHVMRAGGEQVVMIQLFGLRDDISVIMAVNVTKEHAL
jgi:hypothetical protein